MQIYTQPIGLRDTYKNLVIALGTFDGIHLGHQSVIRKAVNLARATKGMSMAFTFSDHPLLTIRPSFAPQKLRDNEEKARIMESLGLDILMNVAFHKDFASISPDGFLRFLEQHFAPRYLVVGPNYTFGFRGVGDGAFLQEHSSSYGFETIICPPVEVNGEIVSSSRIRGLVVRGQLDEANALLGRPVSYAGIVIHGEARGRSIGFPTANIHLSDNYTILSNGVYVIEGEVDKETVRGIANIGSNPTFDGVERHIEVYLFDFDRDIYGRMLRIRFLKRIRGEVKFPSPAALIDQIHADVKKAKAVFA
ncbi:bifunctional riboflavin kinase/FAD synthetase [Selenomonas sp. TAMA-11512]|uniref:bifunctional riboflavin kinase/FAD synthetase n=1 Tax=Selenomonas sp. TAMA-11512 TaxID=3095337 RepID=UPI0030911B22|nr:bifunctional riboflavin kinase/FAD synthetase [Selenomonas sp. TAMA-11512]